MARPVDAVVQVKPYRILSDVASHAAIEAGFGWYESEQPGLGLEFLIHRLPRAATAANQMKRKNTIHQITRNDTNKLFVLVRVI